MSIRSRLTSRPELLLVAALVVLIALLHEGLPLGIAGIGVVAGCIVGLQAMGMVLLYSRTRILSFAQFGLGAFASVFFFLWVQYNQFAVLADGVCGGCLSPQHRSLSWLQHHPDAFRDSLRQFHPWVLGANLILSAVLCIWFAASAGRQVYGWLTIFTKAPRIVPTVATLALAVFLSGASNFLTLRTSKLFGHYIYGWWPYGPRQGTGIKGRPAIPEGTFQTPGHNIGGFTLSAGAKFHLFDIACVAIAVLALVALTLRFRLGRRGLMSRATASDAERAATLGVDVVAESFGPWRFAGALSGLAGVLSVALAQSAPSTGIDMGALTVVLAAVVLARMSSPGLALLFAIALGVLDQGMFWNFHSHTQFEGGLVLVIAAALLLQRGRASRAERASESVFTTAAEPPPVPRELRRAVGVHGLLRTTRFVVAFVVICYPLVTSPSQLSLGTNIVCDAVIGLSLLVLSGWAGQVSFGQLAIAAVGAYVVAIAAAKWHVPMPIALLLGALVGMIVAPLVGLPALRLPGPFVAIMSLTFALAIPAVLLNPQLLGKALPTTLARPVVLGIDLHSDRYFYWFSVLVCLLALGLVAGLRRSRLRRALIASRDNAQAAASFGVDITRLRIEGFAVSGLLAGLGGGLFAFASGGVTVDTFSTSNSVVIFLLMVVGGMSSVSGPILGAAVFGIATLAGGFWISALSGLGAYWILALRPAGIAGFVTSLRDAAIRIVMHLQGHDQVRTSGDRIAISDRGAQAALVPVRYRITGDGFGPVEGTRLRSVEGTRPVVDDVSPELVEQVEEALSAISCHRLDVAYGGAVALSGVSLSVAPGEILAVVGLNGAGKTSLLRALAGLEPAAHGTVELMGTDVTAALPHLRAMSGLAYVPGGAAVLPALSVRDNLIVAGASDEQLDAAYERFPVLRERADTAAGNLSGGEQQVLAIAQAVVREPSVLLVDELSLGLSPEALRTVLDLIKECAQSGTAIMLVEQSISTAMVIADTALFLESGRVRYQGPAKELRDHPELFSSIAFGASAAVAVGAGSEIARAGRLRDEREPVLRVEDLSAAYGDVVVVDGVSFEVTPGEVLGVLGPNGAGKTSLFDCLSGTLSIASGSVVLQGEDVTKSATHARAARGLMRSFQSVQLFPSLTVRDCVAVALETRLDVKSSAYSALWLPPARKEERRVEERVDALLELLTLQKLADVPVASLSLGSRRMVDLACQLAARPKVLLLDEPTSGLAHSETELLGPLVSRISADLDCAVVIIEHNIQVLASVAHRLMAMRNGAVIAQGTPSAVLSDVAVRSSYFEAVHA